MKIERTKLLTLLVIALVCLNLSTLATIWLRKPMHIAERERLAGPKKFIIEKLQFNEEQIAEFSTLVDEHREQMKDLCQQIFETKEEFYDQLKNDKPDTALAYLKIAAITNYEQQAERLTFDHFKKVRAICNERQKQKFDMVINNILKTMMTEPHGPHHGAMGPPPGGAPMHR